jgi:uncharacterized protein YchJ
MPAPIQQNSTNSTLFHGLSPVQAQVAAALAQGRTFTAAASEAGIHRSTIHNWLNKDKAFLPAVENALAESQEQQRDQLMELKALALKTLRELVEDPKASPSVRLKAALAILKRSDLEMPAAPEESAPEAQNFEQHLMQRIMNMEKDLHQPIPTTTDTTARNAPCPCGSGLKFKRCCGAVAPAHISQQACA